MFTVYFVLGWSCSDVNAHGYTSQQLVCHMEFEPVAISCSVPSVREFIAIEYFNILDT